MRKTLLRKQFYQFTRAITGNPKTGERRKLGGIIGMAAVFVLCWVSMMMAFFGTTAAFTAFFEMGLAWYYYASMALVTLAVCVVMTIFTALSTIYNAKDNELLLAMPIQPKDILFARLFEVWTLSMLFALMVAIPTMVRWFALANASALGNLFAILMFFLIPLLGVALAC
ncbi:MAG: hypothetical protein IKX91_01755, partial [Firmicutes bacterium]|nr:hypothetical protein [Bacillota bacterium]